jgi:hypothetical protein
VDRFHHRTPFFSRQGYKKCECQELKTPRCFVVFREKLLEDSVEVSFLHLLIYVTLVKKVELLKESLNLINSKREVNFLCVF